MALEFLSLSLALFALGFGGIIALRFKIPPVIIFLFIGVIIGSFKLITQTSLISLLGNLGIILLLFAIGTEFSIYELFKTGFRKAVTIAMIEIAFTFLLLFLIFSRIFQLDAALLLALALSATSTAISIKLLQELHVKMKVDVSMIIKISVIEDLIAVFIFTVISSVSLSSGQTISHVVLAFVISVVLFTVAYSAFYLFFSRIIFRYNIDTEDLLVFGLGLLLLLVSIATVLNLSTAFGAYIAGSIVSTWKSRWKTLESDLAVFSYVFVAFFFLTAGLQVNLFDINYLILIAILPIVIVVKWLGVFGGSFAATKSIKTSLSNSHAMLPRGEIALVIVTAAVSAGILSANFIGTVSFLVILTTIASYLALKTLK